MHSAAPRAMSTTYYALSNVLLDGLNDVQAAEVYYKASLQRLQQRDKRRQFNIYTRLCVATYRQHKFADAKHYCQQALLIREPFTTAKQRSVAMPTRIV